MGKRIVLLDALRGFALLGIIISHFNHWYVVGPLPDRIIKKDYGYLSSIAEFVNANFVSNKFYLLFSFIFGFSLCLLSESFKQNHENADLLLLRRAFFLFLIGLIHYLFWNGDILMVYAILMLPMIVLRKLNVNVILIIGFLLVLNIPGMVLETYHALNTKNIVTGTATSTVNPITEQLYYAVAKGSVKDLFHFNAHYVHARIQYQIWSGSLFIILGCFLLGTYAAKTGLLQKTIEFKKQTGILGLTSFIALVALQSIARNYGINNESQELSVKLLNNLFVFFQSMLALTMYITLIAVFNNMKRGEKAVLALANIGRMALTIYLLQTVIGMNLFYHIGFGVFGKTSPAMNFGIAILIYLLQLVIANIWYRYFKYGIVEWLLRIGTLMKYIRITK